MKIFQPFVYDARVSLPITPLQPIPIKILRDTGAPQSLILTNTLPFSTQSYSGKNVLMKVHSSEYVQFLCTTLNYTQIYFQEML